MIDKKIKVFETFAGIGAQHKALDILKSKKYLDYEIVATSEWDIWANISYNAIHNNNKNIAKKLTDQQINSFLDTYDLSNDSKELSSKQFVRKLPRNTREMLYSSIKINNNLGSILNVTGDSLLQSVKHEESEKNAVDLLTYSFPCQDLSTAGNFHDSNKGMKKGSGTRSGLLWQIERILRELDKKNQLPKYLLLENVKNMLSKKHIADYEEWITFLHDELGYNTQTYELNSKDFDAAQARTRVYALSVLGEDDNKFHDTFTENGTIIEIKDIPKNISKKLKIDKKLEDVLKIDYSNEKYLNEASLATPNLTPSRIKMYQENPILFTKELDNRYINKQYIQNVKKGYFLNYSRTVTTKQDRHPNSGMISIKGTDLIYKNSVFEMKKNMEFRLLTPRESYLLMGFEEIDVDKILINESIRRAVQYRQAGNSIVVNVLTALFNRIVEIEKEEK